MFLYLYDDKVVGLVVGIINNEAESTYDFVAPKRGRITELVVSSSCRNKGIGEALLNASEDYLFKLGCKDVLLGVFGYNEKAISFYEKHGYHVRMLDMSKDITNNQ